MSDLDKLIQQLKRAGWAVTQTRGGHWKFWSPDGKHAVVTSGTPSDRRTMANLRAQLKRAGFKAVTGRPRKPKAPTAPPPVAEPISVPAPAPAPAAEPTELDEDIAAIDRLLDHLVTFSQLVSKYRAKLAKLREVEQVLVK